MSKNLPFGLTTLVVIVTVALMSGCAPTAELRPLPEPSIRVSAEPNDPGQVVRPISKYLVTPVVSLELFYAEQNVIGNCLSGRARDLVKSRVVDDETILKFMQQQQSDDVTRSSLWGYFDPQHVAEYGYGRAPGAVASFSIDVPDGVSDRAYTSCSESALRRFPTSNNLGPIFSGDPSALPDGGPHVPNDDLRYVTALQSWVTCMKRKGFDYKTPAAALGDARWQSESAFSEQVATAKADMTCKTDSNIVAVGVALESAYDSLYIRSHRAQLAAFSKRLEKYLRANH